MRKEREYESKMKEKNKKFDYLIYIGRFQPFHEGHYYTVSSALNMAKHVIILCGSACQTRTIKNIWSFEERAEMILQSFDKKTRDKLGVLPLQDHFYDEQAWLTEVNMQVNSVISQKGRGLKIGLIGHQKDDTSYYLESFPEWELVLLDNYKGINATDIRMSLFRNTQSFEWLPLPNFVKQFVKKFILYELNIWQVLQEEYNFIVTQKKQYLSLPYPPIFITVDCLIFYQKKLLLIKRKGLPGRGLFALPGGYVNADELIETAALRELVEETNINLPLKILKKKIMARRIYDYPERSLLGRVITHAFLINLDQVDSEEEVFCEAGDDAAAVLWVDPTRLSLYQNQFLDDHYQIIQDMLISYPIIGQAEK